MYFSKVTAFSLLGAAVAAPVAKIAKRDTASTVADAFTGLQDTLAPQLQALTDHFNAADKDSDLDTWGAISDDVIAIGDSIDDLQAQFSDIDTQDGADIAASTDAASAAMTQLLTAFRPIAEHIDEDTGFDLISYGSMNGLGLQISGTLNMANIRLDGGFSDSVSANLGDFADVAEQLPGIGLAVDTDSDEKKKRNLIALRKRASVVDSIVSAFNTLGSDVASDLETVSSSYADADQSSDLKSWQAVSKAIWAVDQKVTTAADAIAKLDQQEGAKADAIIEAATAAYHPIMEAFSPIADRINSDNGFDVLSYGSMSSISAKLLSALQTADYHISGSAVVDAMSGNLADVKASVTAFPALDSALF